MRIALISYSQDILRRGNGRTRGQRGRQWWRRRPIVVGGKFRQEIVKALLGFVARRLGVVHFFAIAGAHCAGGWGFVE